jgi:hypothetical protein
MVVVCIPIYIWLSWGQPAAAFILFFVLTLVPGWATYAGALPSVIEGWRIIWLNAYRPGRVPGDGDMSRTASGSDISLQSLGIGALGNGAEEN